MPFYYDEYFPHANSSMDIIEHHGIRGMKWGHRRAPMSANTRRRIRNVALGAAGVGLAAGAGYLAYKYKIPQRIRGRLVKKLAKKAAVNPVSKPIPAFKPTLPKKNTATNVVKEVAKHNPTFKPTLPKKSPQQISRKISRANVLTPKSKINPRIANKSIKSIQKTPKPISPIFIPKNPGIDTKAIQKQLAKNSSMVNKDISSFKNAQKTYQEAIANLEKLSGNKPTLTGKSKTRRNALKAVVKRLKKSR